MFSAMPRTVPRVSGESQFEVGIAVIHVGQFRRSHAGLDLLSAAARPRVRRPYAPGPPRGAAPIRNLEVTLMPFRNQLMECVGSRSSSCVSLLRRSVRPDWTVAPSQRRDPRTSSSSGSLVRTTHRSRISPAPASKLSADALNAASASPQVSLVLSATRPFRVGVVHVRNQLLTSYRWRPVHRLPAPR